MKVLRKSKVECWPVGPGVIGAGGQVYQQVQVLKRERPRAHMTFRSIEGKRLAFPFAALCHTLTVQAENIVEVKA